MIQQRNEYVEQWIHKAEEDELAILRLTDPDIVAPSVICFYCQQMAEKYLKAFLIFHGKEIIKTHDIEFLLEECGEINPEFKIIDPLNLSDFGVSVRYPGDQYLPSDDEVKMYIAIAFTIEKNVRQAVPGIKQE